VVQLETVTQQNAALVEQAAASAYSFEEQVERLSSMAQVFTTDASPLQVARPIAMAPQRLERLPA
jgi:hypothetical protein